METPLEPSYREITLTQGQVALVDAGDFEWIMQWKWRATWSSRANSFYASANIQGKVIHMHRLILGLERGDHRLVDHKEAGQTLDNRRSNLRVATYAQNRRNSRLGKNNKSGYKGVSWWAPQGKWRAHFKINGVTKYLGTFQTPEQAHAAYTRAAIEHYGEFARP